MSERKPTKPLDLFSIDPLIGPEDLAIRDTVRRYVEDKVKAVTGQSAFR